ncbi:hypothetical protein [Bacillus sp. JCM 19041]|uniref:hypothetical protein n=1 Tax=Bacillus sp. JCM 19041 TaxID=1460637 RepID=UPI0006D03D58
MIVLLIGGVRLINKQQKVEPESLEEVAATKDKKQFIFRMTLEEKFSYIFVAFIFGGWFLASFTPQSDAIEAYKIVEWRIFMPYLPW